eukprot:Lankesteria_metandrocarpae@DN2240_c0_g1_i1.p1
MRLWISSVWGSTLASFSYSCRFSGGQTLRHRYASSPKLAQCHTAFMHLFQDYAGAMCLGLSNPSSFMDCNQVQNFNAIAILVSIPLLDWCLYPFLRSVCGFKLGPMWRFGFGLVLSGTPWAFLLIFQLSALVRGSYTGSDFDSWKPYIAGDYMSIWWFGLPFALGGLAEVFVNVSSMEWAYSASPTGLKSVIMGLNIFTTFLGYCLPGFVVNPFFMCKSATYFYAISLAVHILHLPPYFVFSRKYNKAEIITTTDVDTSESASVEMTPVDSLEAISTTAEGCELIPSHIPDFDHYLCSEYYYKDKAVVATVID